MYEILSHRSKTYIHTVKFRNKAKVVIFFKGRFGGLTIEGGGVYIRRGLYLEGNLRFKIVIIIWWLICAKHYQIYIKHKQIHKTLTNTFETLTNGCTKHYQIIKTLTNIQNTYKHSYFHVFSPFYSYNGLVWYSRMVFIVFVIQHFLRY